MSNELCSCGHGSHDHAQYRYSCFCRGCACEEFTSAQVQRCSVVHAATGAVCQLPVGHGENHRGAFARGISQWTHLALAAPVYPTAIHYDEDDREAIAPGDYRYYQPKEAHGNAEHTSRPDHGRDHDVDSRAHQARSFAARESSLQPSVVEGAGDSREEAIRIALEDLNLHCTDHAPDPDCEGCRTQLVGFSFDLDGPAGGARGCNQAEQRMPQSTGTSPEDIHHRCRAAAERLEALGANARVDAVVSADLLVEAASLLRGYSQVVILQALPQPRESSI